MATIKFCKDLAFKYRLYGPINFVKFSFIEIYRVFLRLFRISFSQFREDVYIGHLLNKKDISYIDIGANDPIKFSNTYKFYLNGGRGINIEPNSIFVNYFRRLRPNDINLNIGISNKEGKLIFYKLNPHVASTFSQQEYLKAQKNGCTLLEKKQVAVTTLKHIFIKYLKTTRVDFLSIDTEKYDYKVLLGNDWKKYRAKIICVESNSPKVKRLLELNNYKHIKTIGLNHVYIDQNHE